MILAGTQGRGTTARRWKDAVEYDLNVMGLEKGMAMGRETEGRRIDGQAGGESGWDNDS